MCIVGPTWLVNAIWRQWEKEGKFDEEEGEDEGEDE